MVIAQQVEAGDATAAIQEHAARVRASGALGRSTMQQRLFDYLLAASLEGRSPKETEIAEALMSRGGDLDAALDGSVRVAVHRLRRKLDDFHAGRADADGLRLTIPRGSYRLELIREGEAAEPETEEVESELVPTVPRWRRLAMPLLVALLALLALAGWATALLGPRESGDLRRAARSALWAPLAGAPRPTFIVVGDYYIFGETDAHGQVQRLVREFAINSRADLDEWLMFSPEKADRYRDLHLSYLPTGTGAALGGVVPIVDAIAGRSGTRPRVITMSELTPEILKSSNIVYVGYLSRLGLLRNALFTASRFEVGSSYDELVDEKSGTHYAADGPDEGRRAASRDLAYLAAFPGPSGNRVVVVAGARDAALMQAAEIAADPAQVDRAAAALGGSDAFEALYTVGALGDLNVTAKLAAAGPMHVARMWSDPTATNGFPDELATPQH